MDNIDNISMLSGDSLANYIDNLSNSTVDTNTLDTCTIDSNDSKTKHFDDIGKNIVCVTCKSSEGIIVDQDYGEVVCTECGIVYDELVDCKPEWKQYNDGSRINRNRCGLQISEFFPKSSLGTQIMSTGYNRLKTLHNWNVMSYEERSLYNALNEISDKCRRGNIKKCVEDTARLIYYKINKCRHLNGKNEGQKIIHRGLNSMALKAACIFYACKNNGETHSLKEISKLFKIEYKKMTKGYKIFLGIVNDHKIPHNPKSSDPTDFILRYCKKLDIKNEYALIAKKISENIDKLGLASAHTPPSLASATIYLMIKLYGLPLTKKDVASKFDISEVTLIKAYNKIEKYKSILIDDKKVNKLLKMKNSIL